MSRITKCKKILTDMDKNTEIIQVDRQLFDEMAETLRRINSQFTQKEISTNVYMTMNELKDYLNLSDVTIYRYIKEFGLPTIKFGNQRRFVKSDIDAWIISHKING